MSDLPLGEAPPERIRIIGVPVDVVNLQSAVARIVGWGRSGPPRTVFLRDVHGLMRAHDDPKLMRLHETNSLTVPDGAPVALVGRMRGAVDIGRAPGADLMEAVCSASLQAGLKHYFFGGKPGVADRMAKILAERSPGLQVCGIYSPPMRDLDADTVFAEAELAEVKSIIDSGADLIWVGLSTPKQEFWMMQAAKHVPHGVFLGVGAAFDFHAGDVARAPRWMRNNGLEWLHRLYSEPRRLWRRYLVLAPRFVLLTSLEEVRMRLGSSPRP